MFEDQNVKINGFFDSKETPDIEQLKENTPDIEGSIQEKVWKDEIISLVKNELERRRQDRIPFELQWRLNMNFLSGNQYCDINLVAQTIYDQEKLFYWQQREVYNQLAPIVETRLAKLGRLRPAMTVIPASSDEDDVSTAKVCKNITDSTYRKLKMKNKIKEAIGWAEICGSVFYKSIWNSNGGRFIGYLNNEPLYEGDIDECVTPAYEIFPDNNFVSLDKCRSLIHAKAYSVDDIYNENGIRLKGEDVDVYSLGMTSVALGGLGYNATIPTIAQTNMKDAVVKIEYYERPSRDYPMGRLIIIAGDELLHYGPLPYTNGEDSKRDFPFTVQNCVDRPGCFWGATIVERCIPVQRAYNAIKNRKHEFLNRAAIGVLTYEDGTIDMEDELEEDGLAPGTVIPRKPGSAPPSFVENGHLPPEFAQEEEKLMNDFIMISGVSELSRNSTAPTGSSGSGISLEILKEQDDTRISLTAENIRIAIIEVAKQWLRLYKQFATGPRMDKVVGKNNEVFLKYWNASDISSDDVVPETEDDLAQTPAQRKQSVYDLLKAGLLVDPDTGRLSREDRNRILEMLNFGNLDSANSMDKLHITKAQKENMDVQEGFELRVRDFDDDVIHLEEHNKFRLSNDYTELERERPDLAYYFDKHVELHQQSIAMKQQQAMQSQLAMQQQNSGPSESIGFKDLPVSGQVQMAAQAGIKLDPNEILQEKAQQQAMQQAQNAMKMQQMQKNKGGNTNGSKKR